MIDYVTQYKKALSKNLHCSGNVKGRLLNKFDSSLTTFLEETATPNMEELCAAFGSPKEMASVLMVEVTAAENTRYRRNSITARIIACSLIGITLFLIVATSIQIYFYKEEDAVYDGEIAIITEYPTPSE